MKKLAKKNLRSARRKGVQGASDALIKQQPLSAENALPLVIEPSVKGVDLMSWGKEHYEQLIEPELLKRGGILFRGFDIPDVETFQSFVSATTRQNLLEYTYRSTPRSEVSGKIYTSTHYPADQSIPMHNEAVYTTTWPMKIWFCCLKVAESQGETPIADSRTVYQRIRPEIRERFIEKKVMYVRNYSSHLDLSWQEVFQCEKKAEVEAYCRETEIEFEWQGEQLTTRQICQSVAKHPHTGEMVWCNQAHLFHASSLQQENLDALLAMVGSEENLPRHVYYGDGSSIEVAVLDEIRAVYDEVSVIFPWQKGDILMLDNMLVAHGRRPFSGTRKVVVGMAEPYHPEE